MKKTKEEENENIHKLAKAFHGLNLSDSSSDEEYWDCKLPIITTVVHEKVTPKEYSHFAFEESSESDKEIEKLTIEFSKKVFSSSESEEDELIPLEKFSTSLGQLSGSIKTDHPLSYIGAYKELKIPKYAPNLFPWHPSVTTDYFVHMNQNYFDF